MCVLVLRKVIQYNRRQTRLCDLFACFLGASKAFDGINHWKLLYKLIDRRARYFLLFFFFVCPYVAPLVQIADIFLCSEEGCFLDFITIANGVWRGSLSPLLVKLYADNLRRSLLH